MKKVIFSMKNVIFSMKNVIFKYEKSQFFGHFKPLHYTRYINKNIYTIKESNFLKINKSMKKVILSIFTHFLFSSVLLLKVNK